MDEFIEKEIHNVKGHALQQLFLIAVHFKSEIANILAYGWFDSLSDAEKIAEQLYLGKMDLLTIQEDLKSSKQRIVPFTRSCVSALAEYWLRCRPNIEPEDYVFITSPESNLMTFLMRILLFIVLTVCLRIPTIACECAHIYDEDVVSLIDSEGDTYLDDYLYQSDGIKTQMIYGIEPPNPKKIIQQAQYAFDSFRYNKCLEKIKEYERVAFPPPYDFPSAEEKLMILAYKAYSNRFLKKYDSAINYFEEMIDIIKKTDYLAPECRFITYFEHAQCYLLKGDRKEFHNRIKKIINADIAPKYDYYVKNNFKIHHQPCFHHHELKEEERMIFKEIAPRALGKELYTLLEERGETPKIRTVANDNGNSEFC